MTGNGSALRRIRGLILCCIGLRRLTFPTLASLRRVENVVHTGIIRKAVVRNRARFP
jgi:hypothetical protein